MEGDIKRVSTWRGDHAVHIQSLIDLANEAGVSTVDENGEYIGLTYDIIAEVLKELGQHRRDAERMRKWMTNNLNLGEVNDVFPTDAALSVMDDAKIVIAAAWPVISTMWGNMVHTLRSAGILPKDFGR